jgi:hypothetical protein
MKKTDLLIGVVIGIIAPLIGSFIFIEVFTPYSFGQGITVMSGQGVLGKVITLGAILNIAAFFVLLRFNKDMMGKGVILATILLTIFTLFL